MNTREFALITFTLLSQMAVGSFVVLGFVHFFAARKAGLDQADQMSNRALLAIGPVLVLAIAASFLHLGNPLNAPRAVTNLANSWLSREIFFTVLFAFLGAIFALMQWRKIGSPGLRNAIALLAALVGLVEVYAEASVYQLTSQPAWNSLATPILFFTTTFLLGGLALGSALAANYTYLQRKEPGCAEMQCDLLRGTVRWIAIVSVVLLGIELVVTPLQIASLAANPAAAATASAGLLFNSFGLLFALRLVLVFVGAGIFSLFLYRSAADSSQLKAMLNYVYLAFAAVLVSEALSRFLFYSTHVKIGL